MRRSSKVTSPAALTLVSNNPMSHKGSKDETSVMSKECAEELRYLLEDAESGELMGFAFTAMYKKGNYFVNTAGECAKSPTFTIGMLEILKTKLVKKVLDKAAGE